MIYNLEKTTTYVVREDRGYVEQVHKQETV